MKVEINDYIAADSDVCHGKPVFKGTRIMVWQVLEMLETESIDSILKCFPSLKREHVRAALSYAANIASGKNVTIVA